MRVPIHVDPEISDLIPDYLVRRRADLAALRRALAGKDVATLSEIGHKMKGSGSSYGFRRISEIGALLERLAEEGDAGRALPLVEELAAYLDGIELVYE